MAQKTLEGIPPHYPGFTLTHTHIQTHSVGLPWTCDQPEARGLYPITHNIHKKRISVAPAGFEPAIPASEQPQTHALDRAATEIRPKRL